MIEIIKFNYTLKILFHGQKSTEVSEFLVLEAVGRAEKECTVS